MHVAAIQRYGEDPLIWYFYCQRTGTGHLDLARQTAFPTGVEQLAKRTDLPSSYLAMALWLEGEREQALEMTEKDAKAAPSSWTALNAAVMADRLNAGARRDALLKQVVDQPPAAAHKSDARPHREELVTLARALIADLAAGGKGDLKLADLHAARDRAPERDRCSFNYFLACYLEHHGKTEPAVYYWKQCMAAQDLVMSARTAAGFELHKRGVKPAEWKQLLFAKRDATK